MAIRKIGQGKWMAHVQVRGRRRGTRVHGSRKDALAADARLKAELEDEIRLEEAAALLGVDPTSANVEPPPTLRDFFVERWVPHAKVVQEKSTRDRHAYRWRYILYYLGDQRLDQIGLAQVNHFVEELEERGTIAWAKRKDGKPVRSRTKKLSRHTVNDILAALRSGLRLAEAEGLIPAAPRINLLPSDDSEGVVAPSEEDFQALLEACEEFRENAPYLPEVVEFFGLTGLRSGEVFNLTWRSVDLARRAVRIEKQRRARMVNQRIWTPKGRKFREVPLSQRALEIMEQVAAETRPQPADFVFPNSGGCPYVRRHDAGAGAGKGWLPDAIRSAGLKGRINLHGLRHLFAVRLLTRGVPITVVSELLGHSSIELTVKRYGRYSSDAHIRWQAVDLLDVPAPTARPAPPRLGVVEGALGRSHVGRKPGAGDRKGE